jgi:hypothetical protein
MHKSLQRHILPKSTQELTNDTTRLISIQESEFVTLENFSKDQMASSRGNSSKRLMNSSFSQTLPGR